MLSIFSQEQSGRVTNAEAMNAEIYFNVFFILIIPFCFDLFKIKLFLYHMVRYEIVKAAQKYVNDKYTAQYNVVEGIIRVLPTI